MKSFLKLSKTARLFLSIGIFVVITGSLGLTYSQQVQQQEQLDGELGIAEMRAGKLQIKDLQQQQEELQQKLDEATEALAVVKDTLRQPVASIDVVDEFYAIAYDCNIIISSISSTSIQQNELQGISCSMTTIPAVVSGELSDMINFVTSLNNDLSTGIVNSTQLYISEMEEGDEATTASLRLTVYSYEGD